MILRVLWPEGQLLARIVFYLNFLSNTVCLVSSLFVFFAVAIVLGEVLNSFLIKLLLIQQGKLECPCAVVYSIDSPSSFQFAILSGFARLWTKGVRISEVLYCTLKTEQDLNTLKNYYRIIYQVIFVG